jgi:hypothetical protein
MRAILHVAKHLWQKAFTSLRRLGEIPQQGVTRRNNSITAGRIYANLLCNCLVGLTINFAPPAFAQQNDTVDAEIAQQVRALAFKL